MVLDEEVAEVKKVDFRGVFTYITNTSDGRTELASNADSTMRFFPKSKVLVVHPLEDKSRRETDSALVYVFGSDGRIPAISLIGKRMEMTVKNPVLSKFRLKRSYNPYNELGYGAVYGAYATGVKEINPLPTYFIREYTEKSSLSDSLDMMKSSGMEMPETSVEFIDPAYPENIDSIMDRGTRLLNAFDKLGNPIYSFDIKEIDDFMQRLGFNMQDKEFHRYYLSNDGNYCLELFMSFDAYEFEKDGGLFTTMIPRIGYEIISVYPENKKVPQWKPLYVRENVVLDEDDATSSLKSSIGRDLRATLKKASGSVYN